MGEEEYQIYETCKINGTPIPYFTSILVEIYRPAMTAPAVQQAWPITVPTVTKYTLSRQRFSAKESKSQTSRHTCAAPRAIVDI